MKKPAADKALLATVKILAVLIADIFLRRVVPLEFWRINTKDFIQKWYDNETVSLPQWLSIFWNSNNRELIINIILVVIVIIFLFRFRFKKAENFRFSRRTILIALLCLAVSVIGFMYVRRYDLLYDGSSWQWRVSQMIQTLVIVALFEELIYRGFISNELFRLKAYGLKTPMAIAISAAAFGFAHIQGGITRVLNGLPPLFTWGSAERFITTAAAGVSMALILYYTKDIISLLFIHTANNILYDSYWVGLSVGGEFSPAVALSVIFVISFYVCYPLFLMYKAGKKPKAAQGDFMKKALILVLIITPLLSACAPKPVIDGQGRREIVLATVVADASLERQVIAFNAQHPDYFVTIDEYCLPPAPGAPIDLETYTEGLRLLEITLASSSGKRKRPDIIAAPSSLYHKYAEKGIFSELTRRYEEDIDPAAVYTNVLETLRVDEELYGVVLSFMVSTICRDAQTAGLDMSMQAMLKLQNESPYSIIWGESRTEIFANWLRMYADNFIDWDGGSCEFDDADFIAMLDILRRMPEDVGWNFRMAAELVSTGQPVFLPLVFSDVLMYQAYNDLFAGHMLVSGYPGAEEVLEVYLGSVLAIAKDSLYQEAAWEFITYLISDEGQMTMLGDSPFGNPIPLSKKIAHLEMLKGNAGRRQVDISAGDGVTISVNRASPEVIELFRHLLERDMKRWNYDTTLMSIVSEEAAAFIGGNMPLSAVIENINNRVRLYLSELR